jgi:hypothetical protein
MSQACEQLEAVVATLTAMTVLAAAILRITETLAEGDGGR